ncbi:MAG: single-stranded DNA-binding protein [Planctomycetota bacterium]|jgi:single-strand DNA-binding protein
MHSINLVVVAGHVTQTPALRHTPGGTPVTTSTVALNRRWRDSKTGEFVEQTSFIDIQVWGSQTELLCRRVTKGSPIHVEGRLQVDTWNDRRTGNKRVKTLVVCERLTLLENPQPETARVTDEEPGHPGCTTTVAAL